MFYSRFDAIFYLSTVRYMNEALKHAHDGDNDGAGVAMVEGLSFYRSIQPDVANANASSDRTVPAYFQAAPETSRRTCSTERWPPLILRHRVPADAGRPRYQLRVTDTSNSLGEQE